MIYNKISLQTVRSHSFTFSLRTSLGYKMSSVTVSGAIYPTLSRPEREICH